MGDRQTDRQEKATWWAVTAYNDEIARLESVGEYPDWVKKVYGGREQCPTTGRLHFQGAVQCQRQVRFSQMKGWLPTANLSVARDVAALRKYTMKEETAVGEKTVRESAVRYFKQHEIMFYITHYDKGADSNAWITDNSVIVNDKINSQFRIDCASNKEDKAYKYAVACILQEKPEMASVFMSPAIKMFYRDFRSVFLVHKRNGTKSYLDFIESLKAPHSITEEPADPATLVAGEAAESDSDENILIDEDGNRIN